jgi:hypothetical protein
MAKKEVKESEIKEKDKKHPGREEANSIIINN